MNRTTPLILTAAALIGTGGAVAGAATKSTPTSACKPKVARDVRQDVRAAVQKARQAAFTGADRVAAATPVLDQAVTDGKITAATEKRVLQRIERGPRKRRP